MLTVVNMLCIIPMIGLQLIGVVSAADYMLFFGGLQLIFVVVYISDGMWLSASISGAFTILFGIMWWIFRNKDDEDRRRRMRKRAKNRIVALVHAGRKLRVVEEHSVAAHSRC